MALLQALYNKLHFYPVASTPDWEQFYTSQTAPLPISIRYNPHKKIVKNIEEKVPWEPLATYLPSRPRFTLDPAFHAGAYYVQEASSMFCGYVFHQLYEGEFNHLKVLDLCAAPGGKSTQLASFLPNTALLISNEVIQSRASVLSENISKWGQMNTWVSNLDPVHFQQLPGFFDTIVIDAPCTGSGLWRRDEEAMNEWSENNVQLCSERQKRIIADSIDALKTDGYLIYSTCSYSKQENEDILDWVTKTFEMESVKVAIPSDWHIIETQSEMKQFGYRLAPWELQGEGFFIAVLQKRRAATSISLGKKKNHQKQVSPYASKQAWELINKWFDEDITVIMRNDEYYAIPAALQAQFEILQQANMKLKKTGTAVGKIIKNQIIPHEELAFSIHLQNQYGEVEVDKGTAIQYLRKEEIQSGESLQGWCLIRYEGLGLGWSKWLSNRMNNYYPKHWRIRMIIE